MQRVSVCQISTYRWSFFEDVVRYAAHGFESIGIWRRKLDDFGDSAAIDLLYEMKMSVSSIHWAGGFTGDGQTFADSIEDTVEAIQLAACLNAGCVIILPGSRNGHTTTHARRLLISALDTLVPVAADYGVKLVLEPMTAPANAWTFIESVEDTVAIVENFPSDHLGLVLDTYHVGFDSKVYQSLDQFIDRVELVQLADRNFTSGSSDQLPKKGDSRLPLGHGQIPLETWLSKLQQLGYSRCYELEVHGADVAGSDYHGLLDSTFDYFTSNKVDDLISNPPRTPKAPRLEQQERLID